MSVCLVSAPTATDFEDAADAQSVAVRRHAETPPLGLLALAAVLEAKGSSPAIINLNSCYYNYLASLRSGVDNFAPWAADVILSSKADVYGFSSISSSYPTTIRIAEYVKRRGRTDARHFSLRRLRSPGRGRRNPPVVSRRASRAPQFLIRSRLDLALAIWTGQKCECIAYPRPRYSPLTGFSPNRRIGKRDIGPPRSRSWLSLRLHLLLHQ
jgi:hypothetical protein